jgi:hypothetical protein
VLSQIPPTPTITVMNSTVACPPDIVGAGVALLSSASYGNLWSNGDTTQIAIIGSTGNYWVTQTIAGITSSPSAVVSVSIHPFSVVLPPLGTVCIDDPPILLQGTPVGGFYSGNALSGNYFVPALGNIGLNNVIGYQFSQVFGNDLCIDTAYIRVVVSPCVGIEENLALKENVSIYFSKDYSNLVVESKTEPIQALHLMDLKGNVFSRNSDVLEASASMDVQHLPPGIYLLELKFQSRIHRERVVKLLQ